MLVTIGGCLFCHRYDSAAWGLPTVVVCCVVYVVVCSKPLIGFIVLLFCVLRGGACTYVQVCVTWCGLLLCTHIRYDVAWYCAWLMQARCACLLVFSNLVIGV